MDLFLTRSYQKTLLSYRQDPNYWRLLTRSTFRIPEQPLLQADGARWQWLYKNLLTKTQLFTWGSNGSGNLGHASDRLSPTLRRRSPRGPPFVMRRERGNNSIIGWPRRVPLEAASEKIGIVADVQCGLVN